MYTYKNPSRELMVTKSGTVLPAPPRVDPDFMPPVSRLGLMTRMSKWALSWIKQLSREIHWWFISGVCQIKAGDIYYIPFIGDAKITAITTGDTGRDIVVLELMDLPVKASMSMTMLVFENIPKKLIYTNLNQQHLEQQVRHYKRGGLSLHNGQ